MALGDGDEVLPLRGDGIGDTDDTDGTGVLLAAGVRGLSGLNLLFAASISIDNLFLGVVPASAFLDLSICKAVAVAPLVNTLHLSGVCENSAGAIAFAETDAFVDGVSSFGEVPGSMESAGNTATEVTLLSSFCEEEFSLDSSNAALASLV